MMATPFPPLPETAASGEGDGGDSPSSPIRREFDMVIVGSTGFVGKLATTYLLQTYGAPQPNGFRWAISGRNPSKMKKLEQEVGGDIAKVPKVMGDCDDAAFVKDLARRTHVIVAFLTPYTQHGGRLVEACVDHGTHYCDITGEMLWIRDNIDKYHAKALEKKVKVVHACGLGSMPADLSAFLLVKKLRYIMGQTVSSIGGGTMTSYATLVGTAKKEGKILHMLRPDLLSPEGTPVRVIHRLGLGFDADVGRWWGPLWLAGLDAEIVARSGSLLGYEAGVEWVESLGAAGLLMGLFISAFNTIAAYTMVTLLYLDMTRWLLTKLRPPGTGPNRLIRELGFGEAYLVARGVDKAGRTIRYLGRFDIPGGDPGYQETAKMAVEAALCLVLGQGEGGATPGGVLTPAAAFGEALMTRLHEHTGMTFTLDRA